MSRRKTEAQLLARLADVERRLDELEAVQIAGQQTIPVVATIGSHAYEGPGPCRSEFFGEVCGAHRDLHQLVDDVPS